MKNRGCLKCLIAILCIGLQFNSVFISSYADTESDVTGAEALSASPSSHWVSPHIGRLVEAGVVRTGEFSENEFDAPMTRGRFLELFVRILPDRNTRGESRADIPTYADISEDSPYYEPIYKSHSIGLIHGFPDGTFGPENTIARQDMFAIIGRAYVGNIIDSSKLNTTDTTLKFADDASIQNYAKDYIYLLASNEVIYGYDDNTVRPFDSITCAEVLAITERIYSSTAKSGDSMNETDDADEKPDENTTNTEDKISGFSTSKINPNKTGIASTPTSPSGNSQVVIDRSGNNGYSNIRMDVTNVIETVNTSDNAIPYVYDDSIAADFDQVLDLKNVVSVRFLTTYAVNKSITVTSTQNMKTVIDTLRGLKFNLSEPQGENMSGGSTALITLNYADGTSRKISFGGLGVVNQSSIPMVFYPFDMTYDEVVQAERKLISVTFAVHEQVASEMFPPSMLNSR